jgi:hypothetical protein
MVVIEMRDAAYDTAFELLDEAKHSAKKTKLTLCELEDAIYDCYEASKDDREDDEYEDTELGLRSKYSSRNYRHDDQYGADEDEEMDMRSGMRRSNRRSGMRMRRNRLGRFV